MKTKHRVFEIENDIYPFKVVFCIGKKPTPAQALIYCKASDLASEDSGEPSMGGARALTIHYPHGSFVWIQKPVFDREWMECFCHEMIHVASNLSSTICQPMNNQTDECHAYFIGWVVSEFMKNIK